MFSHIFAFQIQMFVIIQRISLSNYNILYKHGSVTINFETYYLFSRSKVISMKAKQLDFIADNKSLFSTSTFQHVQMILFCEINNFHYENRLNQNNRLV